MNDRLKALYHEIIVKHSKKPFHFEKKMPCDYTVDANNPVCGDNYNFYIHANSERINDIYFHGFGCAISKASNSILVESINNQDWQMAYEHCCSFLDYLDNKNPGDREVIEPSFEAFSAVHEFPARMDCATLGWREIRKFLESHLKKNGRH